MNLEDIMLLILYLIGLLLEREKKRMCSLSKKKQMLYLIQH